MVQTLTEPQINESSTYVQNSHSELDAIYRSLGRELWASFYAFCGDAERASDAVQEAFLRLQQQDMSGIRDPRSWLQHVGRNWLRDVARKAQKAALSDGGLLECPDSKESAATSSARTETLETVRSAMEKLCELDRLALSLRYGMKWPAARIAETLETTPQAIDMRLCRARSRLRDVLLDMQPDFAVTAL